MRLEIVIPWRKPERKSDKFNGLPVSDNVWNTWHWGTKYKWKEKLGNEIWFTAFDLGNCYKFCAPMKITFIIYKAGIENDVDNLRTKEWTDFLLKYLGFTEIVGLKQRVKDDKTILLERPQVKTIPVKKRELQKTVILVESL